MTVPTEVSKIIADQGVIFPSTSNEIPNKIINTKLQRKMAQVKTIGNPTQDQWW